MWVRQALREKQGRRKKAEKVETNKTIEGVRKTRSIIGKLGIAAVILFTASLMFLPAFVFADPNATKAIGSVTVVGSISSTEPDLTLNLKFTLDVMCPHCKTVVFDSITVRWDDGIGAPEWAVGQPEPVPDVYGQENNVTAGEFSWTIVHGNAVAQDLLQCQGKLGNFVPGSEAADLVSHVMWEVTDYTYHLSL